MKMHPWELANDAAMDSLKWPRTVPVRLERGTRDFDAFLIEQGFQVETEQGFSIQFKLSEEEDAGFVATYKSGNECRFAYNRSRDKWEDWFVTDCLRRNDFARQFFFWDGQLRQANEIATERLLVWNDGRATWQWHEQVWWRSNAYFSWGAPMDAEEFLFLPILDVWAQIENQLADERGEAAFARSFARQSEKEREATVCSLRAAARLEMKQMLRCLLIAHGMNEDNEEEPYFLRSDRNLWGSTRRKTQALGISDELQRDIERVWRHFEPFDPRIENFECVRKVINARLLEEAIYFSPSTAHEKMEAMMRWRDWLEESGA